MKRNSIDKIRSQTAAWSVEPLRYPEPDEIAAALLATIEAASRCVAELETELRRIPNAPERVIR